VTAQQVYRDDGPLALLIGRLGRARPVDETALTFAGAALVALAAALTDDPLPLGALTAAVVVAVIVVAAGSQRSHGGRLAWLVPPLLRVLEYAFLIRLTVVADRDAMPLCFALLAVLAFHHYDTVYRLRHQRLAPPAWLRAAGGGWEGRVLAASVLALAGVLGPGLLVAAIGLGALFLTETVVSWVRYARAERPAVLDDEDDEVQDA
jgi:Family of unknown function (DUF5941)